MFGLHKAKKIKRPHFQLVCEQPKSNRTFTVLVSSATAAKQRLKHGVGQCQVPRFHRIDR